MDLEQRQQPRRAPLPRQTESGAEVRPYRAAPRTWSESSVLEAIRAWADRYGSPPRRFEWSPTTSRRHGLIPADVECAWERDGCWPSVGAVEQHCGSWAEALVAAGFTHKLRPSLPLQERILAAKRMRASGLSRAEVAAYLEVGLMTVTAYTQAMPCRRCPNFVVNEGRYCLSCVAERARERKQRRPPSRQEIIEAVRAWHEETGAVPRAFDWRRAQKASERPGKWEREYPRWPTLREVELRFPTFPDAVLAAGLAPGLRYWSKEEALEALRELGARLDRTPRDDDLTTAARERTAPSQTTLVKLFGSVDEALAQAGFPSRTERPRYSDEELLGLLAAALDRYGRRPTYAEWRRNGERPSYETVKSRFGTWTRGFELAARRARGSADPAREHAA